MATSALLAHQGGWDEALFVAVPMLVVAILLKLAKRRMAAAQANARPAPNAEDATGDDATSSDGTANGEDAPSAAAGDPAMPATPAADSGAATPRPEITGTGTTPQR